MITTNDDEVYVDLAAIKIIRKGIFRSEPASIIDVGPDHCLRIKTPEFKELIRIVSDAKCLVINLPVG
jgi:hypothetical protein